ncbi:MAG: YqjD family protein [Gammaproteobacteria bacterium]
MIEPIPTRTNAREQLMSDLKSVIADAEQWLRSGSHLTGEDLAAAKAKFERTLSGAKADLIRLEEAVVEKAKVAAKTTDEFVTENPWKAVGIGAAVGLALGVLISRR